MIYDDKKSTGSAFPIIAIPCLMAVMTGAVVVGGEPRSETARVWVLQASANGGQQ